MPSSESTSLVPPGGYLEVAHSISHYLVSQLQTDGSLYDEVKGGTSPDDHYASPYLALSLLVLGLGSSQTKWVTLCDQLVQHYLSIPRRRSSLHEFSDLALLLVRDVVQANQIRLGSYTMWLLDQHIHRMSVRLSLNRNVSNNILTMAALCGIVRHSQVGTNGKKCASLKFIEDQILKWQLDDGLFVDYPAVFEVRRQGHFSVSTPLTYHAKTCALLVLMHQYLLDDRLKAAIIHGLRSLQAFVAHDGETFYYGRTNNGLFGYASAIYAYEMAGRIFGIRDFRLTASVLFGFIRRWQRPKGYIALTPNDAPVAERVGWDEYMYLTVYNAYAAAMFGLLSPENLLSVADSKVKGSGHMGRKADDSSTVHDDVRPLRRSKRPKSTGILASYASQSGLLTAKTEDAFIAISTKGQFVPGQSHLFIDNRYVGMNLLCLQGQDQSLLPPPPLVLGDNLTTTVDPRLDGFLTCVHHKGHAYSARVYEQIHLRPDDEVITVTGMGVPMRVDLSSSEIRRYFQRARGKFARALTGRFVYPYSFRVDFLECARQYRFISWLPRLQCLLWGDVFYFSPAVEKATTMASAMRVFETNSSDIYLGSYLLDKWGRFSQVYENTLGRSSVVDVGIRVPTSRGYARAVPLPVIDVGSSIRSPVSLNMIYWGNPQDVPKIHVREYHNKLVISVIRKTSSRDINLNMIGRRP